jgi:DNA repair exonuclease SbcCD ATPase subunit
MRTMLNLGPTALDMNNRDIPHSGEDAVPMADLMEQTRSEVRGFHIRLEQQALEQESHARRTRVLYFILAGLLVLLGISFWLEYPALRDARTTAAGMPGLQNVTNSLGEQLNAVETKLGTALSGLPGLTERMDQLQSSMKSTLQSARSQAQTAATQVGRQIRADVELSIQAIQSRLAGVESNQREASERINQLEEQIAALKLELASVREQSSASTEQISKLQEAQQAGTAALSSLDQRMNSNQTALDSLATRVDRKRFDFQVPNRRTEQIVPGIYLTVKHTDTGKQQVDATLELGADSRVLTIHAQGIHKPAVFYTSTDDRPIDLVFTDVQKNQVAGYLMMAASQN